MIPENIENGVDLAANPVDTRTSRSGWTSESAIGARVL